MFILSFAMFSLLTTAILIQQIMISRLEKRVEITEERILQVGSLALHHEEDLKKYREEKIREKEMLNEILKDIENEEF